jgi:hypothetical protein
MKNEFEEYLETGMLGAYQPENAILREDTNGSVGAIFRDTEHRVEGDSFTHTRRMLIEGRRFQITSVFSGEATATPTDKLLSLIDTELKKEANSA